MKTTHVARRCITGLALLLMACGKASSEVPQALLDGTWQITAVHVDTGATRTLAYGPNDPRLVGRLMVIDGKRFDLRTPEHVHCEGLRQRTQPMTTEALLTTTLGGRATDAGSPDKNDYKLPWPAQATLAVQWLACDSGSTGPDDLPGPSGENWLVPLQGRLYLRWFDASILQLTRLSGDESIKASFNCGLAKTASEKAICTSPELAGYDRSVAAAFKNRGAIYQDTADSSGLAGFRASQKQWLMQRDACRADTECLRLQMEQRLEQLSQLD